MEDFKDIIEPLYRSIDIIPEDFLEVNSGISSQKVKLLGDSDRRRYLASFGVIKVCWGTHLVYTETRQTAEEWHALDQTRVSFKLLEQPKPKIHPEDVNKGKLFGLKQLFLTLLPP